MSAYLASRQRGATYLPSSLTTLAPRSSEELPPSRSRGGGGGCDGRIVPVPPVLEPADNDERDSDEEKQPSDNDEREGRAVMSVKVGSDVVVEPPSRSGPRDDDNQERDESEEVGEDLAVCQ